jgi:hypothetical protein
VKLLKTSKIKARLDQSKRKKINPNKKQPVYFPQRMSIRQAETQANNKTKWTAEERKDYSWFNMLTSDNQKKTLRKMHVRIWQSLWRESARWRGWDHGFPINTRTYMSHVTGHSGTSYFQRYKDYLTLIRALGVPFQPLAGL